MQMVLGVDLRRIKLHGSHLHASHPHAMCVLCACVRVHVLVAYVAVCRRMPHVTHVQHESARHI